MENVLRNKAFLLGAQDLKKSTRKNKKWAVLYNNKWIHFGDKRYEDYTQHGDEARRDRYLKRSTMITNKEGKLTAFNPQSPNYWSIRLLW